MSRLGLLVSLFPALALAVDVAASWWFVARPGPWTAAALLVATYGLPLVVYRALTALRPVREGRSRLTGPRYSPWWGAHQVQLIYDAFPVLEVPLRLVPGLYSAWLRAWGSRVGRGVYWTPRVEITDRGLLDVGDGAVFGHRAKFFGHLIAPGRAGVMLYVKRGKVGDGAFIGAYAVLGPGADVPPGAVLKVGQHVNARDRYDAGTTRHPVEIASAGEE